MATTRTYENISAFKCDTGFMYYTWDTDYNQCFTTQQIHDTAHVDENPLIGTTTSTTEVTIGTVTYIYPKIHSNVVLIDGVVTGNVTIDYYNSVGGNTTRLIQITVDILRIHSSGSIDTVVSKDIMAVQNITTSGTTNKKGYVIVIPVEDATYEYELHRFGVRITVNGSVSAGTGYYYLSLTKNMNDFYIQVPYV